MSKVRVRFAPSPTGGLHIGGLRTALFNYLFAKKNGGDFILRIEDTDQARYVKGAEEYIQECLEWSGLTPDESPQRNGPFAPYRQSERKEIYGKYAQQLLNEGNAYYAFDTSEELDEMREKLKSAGMVNLNYNSVTRMTMKNSLTLSAEEVQSRINANEPYVIRIKVPEKQEIRLNDMIRGWVMVHSSTLDDKVLMKSDGLPTYHLANIVDDHLMQISHVIRGEEWLPSAPLHVLLYQLLGWEDSMPSFAHLPLILKPDGNGKLSKRAADKAGFPIFPLDWTDTDGNHADGFREAGYLPEAMVNFLAFLGWNPGGEKELYRMNDLVEAFSIERIGKAGTKFDIEKAQWYNQQYIKSSDTNNLAGDFIELLRKKHGISCDPKKAEQIVELLKARVTFGHEFVDQALYFFQEPLVYDEKVLRKKWTKEAANGLSAFAKKLQEEVDIDAERTQILFQDTLQKLEINPGKVMQALRLSLTGEGSGPDLMQIIAIMDGKSASDRINYSLQTLHDQINE